MCLVRIFHHEALFFTPLSLRRLRRMPLLLLFIAYFLLLLPPAAAYLTRLSSSQTGGSQLSGRTATALHLITPPPIAVPLQQCASSLVLLSLAC